MARDFSTAAISRARCSDACWPDSICCAFTTCRRRPTSRWRSTSAVALISVSSGRQDGVCSASAAEPASASRRRASRGGVPRDRAFGTVRAGRGSDLDAPAFADAGRDGVHVFDHPGGVSRGAGNRKRGGIAGLAIEHAARGSRWAVCQLLLAAASRLDALTRWPIRCPTGRSIRCCRRSPWFTFQLDLMRCVWAILPAAMLWGASFPLALAAVASRGQDPGQLVGGVYAANTVGGDSSARWRSASILIPWIGHAGFAAAADRAVGGRRRSRCFCHCGERWGNSASVGIDCVAAWWRRWSYCPDVAAMPWLAIGLRTPDADHQQSGASCCISARGAIRRSWFRELPDGKRYFHVSGKVEASTEPYDMRLQRMLGHLPALIHPNPKSVLIVGFGAGVTAGTFVVHPGSRATSRSARSSR